MARTAPFDQHAAAYDDWFERNELAYQSELEAVRTLLPKYTRAVEVGVGTGRFAAPLGIGLGIEPSAAMARLASSRGVRVLDGVAEHLPLEDASFDLVLMVTVLCFVDDVPRALQEVARVLIPGGRLVVGFIDRGSEFGSSYERRKSGSPFYSVAEFRSSGELLAALQFAGFGDLAVVQTIFEPPEMLRTVSCVEPGSGRGLFAVVRATKMIGSGRALPCPPALSRRVVDTQEESKGMRPSSTCCAKENRIALVSVGTIARSSQSTMRRG
jgi:SAM-dependent methyltransferase